MSLLAQSRQIKKEADSLLRQTALLEFLEKLGKMNFVGSYRYDLMIDGDVDLHIVNPLFTKEKSVAVLNALIKANKFRGYLYYDFTARRRAGFPKGYYIGLKTKFKGRKWKIDIWLLKKASRNDDIARLVERYSNPRTKLQILRLKDIVKAKRLPFTSVEIYRAVFLNDVRNLSDLKRLTADKLLF